jgi:signal transduction histidine kinase
MSKCRPAETGSDHTDADDVNELRQRLQQAQAGERRAQALLESVASLMGLSDPVAVMRGVAENAVRHVGVPRACVYRVDHDAGVLIATACTERNAEGGEVPLPGMAPIRQMEIEAEPIAMRPGNHLAEFAMGERPDMRTTGDRVGEPLDEALLVQMRTGRGTEARGALVGVIVASTSEPPTTQQKTLLRSLASMGAATAEAARIEEFRSQLVSAVSHELRTPLAAIRAYNELLLDEDAGEINEEQRLFLERIETTCLHLDRMVEDLLDLSRLRAGEMVIRRRPVDVVGVIEHIMDTLSPEAAKREVALSDEIVGELPQISSNSDRLAQVLFNLVGNAVKYVDEGGCVLVRAGMSGTGAFEGLRALQERFDEQCNVEDGRSLVIQVIDDGPGIAEDEQQRIFDEFYRGRLTEPTTKGSGLGLAIASRLTRLLGGLLEVDSTPGEGSTFWLIFPCEVPDHENTRQGGR